MNATNALVVTGIVVLSVLAPTAVLAGPAAAQPVCSGGRERLRGWERDRGGAI